MGIMHAGPAPGCRYPRPLAGARHLTFPFLGPASTGWEALCCSDPSGGQLLPFCSLEAQPGH